MVTMSRTTMKQNGFLLLAFISILAGYLVKNGETKSTPATTNIKIVKNTSSSVNKDLNPPATPSLRAEIQKQQELVQTSTQTQLTRSKDDFPESNIEIEGTLIGMDQLPLSRVSGRMIESDNEDNEEGDFFHTNSDGRFYKEYEIRFYNEEHTKIRIIIPRMITKGMKDFIFKSSWICPTVNPAVDCKFVRTAEPGAGIYSLGKIYVPFVKGEDKG